jgi:hypothetical protein
MVTAGPAIKAALTGPPAVTTICGTLIGITWSTNLTRPPPLRRRFAGSSVTETGRSGNRQRGHCLAPGPASSEKCSRTAYIAKLPCVIDSSFNGCHPLSLFSLRLRGIQCRRNQAEVACGRTGRVGELPGRSRRIGG